MAIGVFILSRKKRGILAITLIVLNILEILLGCYICGTSLYIYISVAPNLSADRTEVIFVFTVTGMFGFNVILHYLTGLQVLYRMYYKSNKKTTKRILCWWTFAGVNTLLNVIFVTLLSVEISKHIVRALRHSLERGLRHYLKNAMWKKTIDELQFKLQCCGVNSYKDWYNAEWLSKYQIDKKTDIVKQLRLSEDKLFLPIVPWSCCKLEFPMQCLHDPLQQIESLQIWQDQPEIILQSLNEDGCLSKIRRPIEDGLIGYILASGTLLIINIIIVLISRILYSSCRNAILLSEVWGFSPGWIFGRGDFGYRGGKSAWDYMQEYYETKNISREQIDVVNPNTPTSDSKSFFSSFNTTNPSNYVTVSSSRRMLNHEMTSEHEPVSSDDERALLLK